jgi:hypothetical protein
MTSAASRPFVTQRLCPLPALAALAALFLCPFATAPSAAKNLIANGDFDRTVSSWDNLVPEERLVDWDALDVADDPRSGSLRFENRGATDNGGFPSLSQCVRITPGLRYRASARAFVPGGQDREARVMLLFSFFETSNCNSHRLDDVGSDIQAQTRAWHRLETATALAVGTAQSIEVRLAVRKVGGGASVVAYFDDVVLEELAGDCEPTDTSLCLLSGRFRVSVDWSTINGSSGSGTAIPNTSDSGLFWFFDQSNLELLVKVLDGCSVNQNVWFFAAATTNVAYRITVTDTQTGMVKQWLNPQGRASPAITDVSAFAGCP